jgi:PAS domain S-box-containing protein
VLADEDGKNVDVNTQAVGKFGYSRAELIGARVVDLPALA